MNADDLIDMGSGITLRMYLIAHAPEEPQDWFQPSGIEPVPPQPLRPSMTEHEVYELEDHNDGDGQATTPCVVAYVAACDEYRKAVQRISKEREMQSYIQWPGAWADKQIELENARNKT